MDNHKRRAGNWNDGYGYVTRYRLGIGWKVRERIALIGGVSYNQYFSDDNNGETLPEWISDGTKKNSWRRRNWPGAYIGIEM